MSDVGQDTIRVWGKGNKQISVPISPETRQLLQVLIDQDGSQGADGPLFRGESGAPLERWGVYRLVRRCMDRAGIKGPKKGPHCLRHSLGRHHIASGGNAFTLQRILRHRDIETTQKYVNLQIDEVIKGHHEHSPLRKIFGPELTPGGLESSVQKPITSTLQKVHDALDELAAQIPSKDDLSGSKGLVDKLNKIIRAHNFVAIANGHLCQLIAYQLEDLFLINAFHTHDAEGRADLPDQVVDYMKEEEKFLKELIQEADAKLAKYR